MMSAHESDWKRWMEGGRQKERRPRPNDPPHGKSIITLQGWETSACLVPAAVNVKNFLQRNLANLIY
jgi:hypothetical protein